MDLEACRSKVKLKRMISFDEGLNTKFRLVKTNLISVCSILKCKDKVSLDINEVVTMPYCEKNEKIMISTMNKQLLIMDTTNFHVINTMNCDEILSYGSASKDNHSVLFGTHSGKQFLYNFNNNQLDIVNYNTPYKTCRTMFCNSNSNVLYCGSHKMCQIIDIEYKESVIKLQDSNLDQNVIFNTCDVTNNCSFINSLVAVGDYNGQVSIWNYIDGTKKFHFDSNYKSPINMIKFHPYQTVLAIARSDGKIEIIDLRSDCCISSFSAGSNDRITCMDFSPSGRLLFYGTIKGFVNVWDICTEMKNSFFNVFHSSVKDIVLLKKQTKLVVGGSCSDICIYSRKR